VFGLGRRFEGVDLEWFEREVKLFELVYVRLDLWGKFIGVSVWCDDCERFFKCKMYKI